MKICHQKCIVFAAACMLLPLILFAQNDSVQNKKRLLGFTPVKKNTTINGLAIGFLPSTKKKATRLNINGISMSATPLDIFAAMYGLFEVGHSLSKDTSHGRRSSPLNTRNFYPAPDTSNTLVKLNGLMLGSFITNNSTSNGVSISIVGNGANKMNGLAISGLFNINYQLKGVQIATLHNKTTHARGLQIGLFNSCKTGKLVQLGLINKIGKRALPFINARF